MPYAKAKVYFDGSHYIAIPHTVRKKKAKKKIAVKNVSPELEEMDEDETTPFDECTQMSIFDLEKKTEDKKNDESESVTENEDTPTEKRDDLPQISRKELFDKLYREHLFEPKYSRKKAVYEGLRPHFKTDEEAKLFVDINFERKRRNMICRRIRMTRKANLQDFNFFVTFTYDDKLHTEESFRQKLKNCLSLLSSRKSWKYIGVWERSSEKKRLHFHGIFDIPEGTMPGYFVQKEDYSFNSHRRQITNQDTYFLENFGRNDFEKIVDQHRIGEAMAYLMKYLEKSGERIVYSKGLPQYFITDIMDEDIVCPIGMEEQKLLLFDDFGCWDEGEYIGQVSKETIAKMPKRIKQVESCFGHKSRQGRGKTKARQTKTTGQKRKAARRYARGDLQAVQRKRPARRAFVSVFVWLFVLGRVLVCGGRSPTHLYQDKHTSHRHT